MFDLDAYLSGLDPRLLADDEGRRICTRLDPLLFALVYLPHHLRGAVTGEVITLSEFHVDLCGLARRYVRPIGPGGEQARDVFIAPRDAGKSTWLFTVVPLWLAAHGHRKFVAAFADSATQAMTHLATFRREIDENRLLRVDFPELCSPARRQRGTTVADSQTMYAARSGFVFAARGIDSANLGLKVGTQRPDHLVLDDIEGAEGAYTPTMKKHRLATLLTGILPLNVYASVTMAGTVAIPGAIIDDVAAKQRGEEYPDWVDDEQFTPRYYPAIVTEPETGAERSLWPEKWPMPWLAVRRHTRQFRSQMMNDPLAADTPFWSGDDFTYRDLAVTHKLLSIDPAVTTKDKSDYTALAVIGCHKPSGVCVVHEARQLKIAPGEPLRARVLAVLEADPEIGGVVVETNQGGDLWKAILHHLPVGVRTVHQTEEKAVRAGSLLARYQRGRVVHAKRLPALEGQMVRFPLGAHDDLIDAVGTGVQVFLGDDRPPRDRRPRSASYV